MRICVVHGLYYPFVKGGAELSVKALCEGLLIRHDVRVVSSNMTNRLKIEHVNGVEVWRLPMLNLGHYENYPNSIIGKVIWRIFSYIDILRFRQTIKAIRSFNPDIVLLNNLAMLTPRLAENLCEDLSVVQVMRDFRPICNQMMMPKGKVCTTQCNFCTLRKLNVKRIFKKCHHFVAISKSLKQIFLREGYIRSVNTSVIYNAVPDYADAMQATTKFDAGYIGAVKLTKGTDFFLDIARAMPDKKFCLATQSPYSDFVGMGMTLPDNVEYLGLVAPKDFFSNVRVVLIPSRWSEPFGRVAAEALSAGRPSIVSDQGGLKEIVRDGQDGYVENPYELERWCMRLKSLLNCDDLYLRISMSARARYIEQFTELVMVDKYEDLFKKVLNRRKLEAA